MKLRAGIVTVRGVRLAVALVGADCLNAGSGNALLTRLSPYFPGLPLMLVSDEADIRRAHATFATDALLAELDLSGVQMGEIDLTLPPLDDSEPPF